MNHWLWLVSVHSWNNHLAQLQALSLGRGEGCLPGWLKIWFPGSRMDIKCLLQDYFIVEAT